MAQDTNEVTSGALSGAGHTALSDEPPGIFTIVSRTKPLIVRKEKTL